MSFKNERWPSDDDDGGNILRQMYFDPDLKGQEDKDVLFLLHQTLIHVSCRRVCVYVQTHGKFIMLT